MPEVYIKEMLADWHGAGKAITGKDNIKKWYIDNYYNIQLHRDTRTYIDDYMGMPRPQKITPDVMLDAYKELSKMKQGN